MTRFGEMERWKLEQYNSIYAAEIARVLAGESADVVMNERRDRLATTRRKHLWASIEDDHAHAIASEQEPQERQW